MRFVYRALVLPALLTGAAHAQGTLADYARADSFVARAQGLVLGVAEQPTWIGETDRFWYRTSVAGGRQFVLIDADGRRRGPAFDHTRLALALRTATRDSVTAVTLPFDTFSFVSDGRAIEFVLRDSTWRCGLDDYVCRNDGPVPPERRPGRTFAWSAGPGQLWRIEGLPPLRSPDSTLEAVIQNYNVAVRSVGSGVIVPLSFDGSEGNRYTRASMAWSPDSKKLAVYRVVPGYQREIHYVESSPEDQLQPKYSSRLYAKPGDVLDKQQPVIFEVAERRSVRVNDSLFPNAYSLSPLVWRNDSRRLTFEYNQRGHQVYRIIEIDGATGATRAVISEAPKTFFYYTDARGGGKKFRYDVNDGKEIIWMSERDGWNHLYLYDGSTGKVKNQITRGAWVVRSVDTVDAASRQIWFTASGMNAGRDPYFVHAYRINFDGTGLVAFTEANGTHAVSFSPDRKYYVDRWSRVDLPPIAELRRTSDRSLVMELERADDAALRATGWRYPEVFAAKGRDGVTDIWGIIVRPIHFDSTRRYPVVERIYAGPHGSFVPKAFGPQAEMQALAELGFIVVQVDGMGTSNRSKAFQDVAWKNLADAGFPDRIRWHQAVAARYAYYDIRRMGVFGNSAGGQNALGALLFHPEFYQVAVSSSGSHDNRMDKIWWNELWMSWPLGPQYAAASNVDNAYRLKGKVLLIVPEMDTNVDPSSTLQVVNALIRANKDFDFLMLPGADHGPGGPYGARKRNDFFVRHLLGVQPPDWNRTDAASVSSAGPARQPVKYR
jgi:dipeptidyl aminopeptidase/acylaminoacyl peptidase